VANKKTYRIDQIDKTVSYDTYRKWKSALRLGVLNQKDITQFKKDSKR